LMVAAGEKLPFTQDELAQRGHAIECRIYAEDPANNFLPATGPVLLSEPPVIPNVRIDSGIETGDAITTYYDPMIAKLITYGMNRDAAIQQMQTALDRYILLGLTTNIPFLQEVMASDAFRSGHTTTHFIDEHFPEWQPATTAPTDEILIATALAEILGGVKATSENSSGDGDLYSPWNQLDSFRIGR
jgi:3-methylcrotonyl-CoA carboxylase alpha subunit